jgi:hypothetical protein
MVGYDGLIHRSSGLRLIPRSSGNPRSSGYVQGPLAPSQVHVTDHSVRALARLPPRGNRILGDRGGPAQRPEHSRRGSRLQREPIQREPKLAAAV